MVSRAALISLIACANALGCASQSVERAPARAPVVSSARPDGPGSERRASASDQAPEPPQNRAPFSDSAVAVAVGRQLDHGGGVPAQRVQAQVHDGIVTLSGEVPTEGEARRAEELVEQTRGVRAVLDELSVSGAVPSPAELAANVREALQSSCATAASQLQVRASGGNIQLSGQVPTLATKIRAERAALQVYGVTAVDNRLLVVPDPPRSDAQIASSVQSRLGADSYLYGDTIRVSVDGGVVKLRGQVQSAFAKRRAIEHAAVTGARAVQSSALDVVPDRDTSPPPPTVPDATALHAAILDSYALDPGVPTQGISVTVWAGRVTLSGTVPTLDAKLRAGEDALDAAGAWLVQNELVVRGGAPFTDAALAAKVADRLAHHPYLEGLPIQSSVQAGVVTLSGHVESDFQRREAVRVTAGVPGVTAVESQLLLRPPEQEGRSDAELARQLQRELKWDPRVDASRVQIQVSDGVVTLSGQVPSWEGRNAVLENAFEVSPPRLIDHLQVVPPAQLAAKSHS